MDKRRKEGAGRGRREFKKEEEERREEEEERAPLPVIPGFTID
jgi:hypothetical protein